MTRVFHALNQARTDNVTFLVLRPTTSGYSIEYLDAVGGPVEDFSISYLDEATVANWRQAWAHAWPEVHCLRLDEGL